MKRVVLLFTAVLMVLSILPFGAAATVAGGHVIELSYEKSGDGVTHAASIDGRKVPEYDYVWHIDPTKSEPYYTGTAPSGNDEVYIAHDIYYYPELAQDKFQKVSYDGENEWVYMYEAQGLESYIFSTLPVLKSGFPSQMMHSAEDAYQNAVLHITRAGEYTLKGEWYGQIRIDLGEDSFDDPSQKVTLILDGVSFECSVASGIVFNEVYECDNAWEDRENYSPTVDTSKAGAVIRLADGSKNEVSGTNIFRLLKPKYKDDESADDYPAQKKLLKTDGALYSYRSMNIEGDSGVLNITSGFEGLGSELHLTINGGNVNINSQDDGVNVNEDGVSVLTVNGGRLHVCAGLGAEGDGIDSNGYVVINGGTVISAANPAADSGLDSDKGSYVNGGIVVSLGSAMDWAKADDAAAKQAVLNLRFAAAQSADEAIIITDTDDNVVFAYDPDKDEAMGKNGRSYSGAVVSAPSLKAGESVCIYIGGNVTGNEQGGVYDTATVNGFEGAKGQCYSGNMGMQMDGMQGNRPEKPMGDMGGERSEMPEEQQMGERPEMPEGQMPNENFGAMPQNQMQTATCGGQREFVLSETVNAFQGVSDVIHDAKEQDGKYVCQVCGGTFEDADCTTPAKAPFDWTVVFYILSFLAGALSASLVFIVVLFVKKKKA